MNNKVSSYEGKEFVVQIFNQRNLSLFVSTSEHRLGNERLDAEESAAACCKRLNTALPLLCGMLSDTFDR